MFRAYRIDQGRISLWQMVGWRGVVLLAVALAVFVALAIVATGLFLVLFPIFVIAGLVARFLAGRGQRRPLRRAPDVLEGRYEVLDVDPAQEPGQGPGPGRGWGRREP